VTSFSTGVPADNVVPRTFHVFNFLRQSGSLRTIPLSTAIIGTKSAAGTAVVGTVYDITNLTTTEIDALAGVNSEGALMCRHAQTVRKMLQRGPAIYATFIAENAGGTANVQTITFVGTATADSNQIFRIAGRTFVVGIRAGNLQNTIAAAVANEFKTKADELPVTVSVATNVVTLTHPTKGVLGGDVIVTCEQQVAGCVATVATGTPGAGAADITPGLTALSPLRYDGIMIANHTSTDITAILADIAVRWAPESKAWAYYFVGERGTIGTATSLAAAANHHAVVIASFEGCLNAPGELAVAAGILTFSRERPNAGFDGAKVPLFPPATSTLYTDAEQNTAIKAGLTPFVGVKDSTGQVADSLGKCVQMVTTKTTIGANPDSRLRDIGVSRTGVALALQLDAAVEDVLGPDNNPDGVSQSLARPLLIDLAAAILRAEARATPPVLNREFVEEDVAGLKAEPDPVVDGRNNVKIPYHPDQLQHQVAWSHDVIIGQ
jgi:phage tail sheath gpL-like